MNRLIFSEIRKRKIKNLFKGKQFYFFININTLLHLLKTNFILFNKNKSQISFSLIHDLPQNQHNWIMNCPIRLIINAESLFERYPNIIEINNRVLYEGKKLDLLKHIIQIDIIKDMSYHLPSENLNIDYKEKIDYIYKKINNLNYFPINYVAEFINYLGI